MQLGARLIHIANYVSHARLVAHEGCEVAGLGGVILGEGLDFALAPPAALLGQKPKRSAPGVCSRQRVQSAQRGIQTWKSPLSGSGRLAMQNSGELQRISPKQREKKGTHARTFCGTWLPNLLGAELNCYPPPPNVRESGPVIAAAKG